MLLELLGKACCPWTLVLASLKSAMFPIPVLADSAVKDQQQGTRRSLLCDTDMTRLLPIDHRFTRSKWLTLIRCSFLYAGRRRGSSSQDISSSRGPGTEG
ncbi:hypothetical protein F4803DRAFT_496621 [Xylaria telfairii]|nr:hypothetical protein F4803DRAFT_496621 [Xylaria telfairii]